MANEASGDQPKQIEIRPISSIEEAQEYLLNELHACALAYDRNRQRDGMIRALEAVISFLDGRGFPPAHLKVFSALIHELDCIYEGKRSLILQPGIDSVDELPVQHKGPGKQQIRIYAAACSEAIYRLGLDEDQTLFSRLTRTRADEKVAQAMQSWPAYDQTYKVTWRTIKGWRDKFEAGAWGEHETDKYRFLVGQFMKDDTGRKWLGEVMRKGPRMTGGFQKTSNCSDNE